MTLPKIYRVFLSVFLLVGATAHAQHSLRDSSFVQTDTLFDKSGKPDCFYTRTFSYSSEKPTEITVAFTFTTEINQAISYRQEILNGNLEWIEKGGLYKREGIVEVVTANLSAHSSITWKYRYKVKNKPANKIITFDKSALLVMNGAIEVKKIILITPEFLLK